MLLVLHGSRHLNTSHNGDRNIGYANRSINCWLLRHGTRISGDGSFAGWELWNPVKSRSMRRPRKDTGGTCRWRRVKSANAQFNGAGDKCARGRRGDAVGVCGNGGEGMRGGRRVGGTSANSISVEQVQPRPDGGVLCGGREKGKYKRAWMGVVKKVKGRRRGRVECGCGVGMREGMRVPFFVGDFEMASMSRKGRLVIFLMRAVTLRNDGEVKAESRED
jgi:hypothetical protein